MEKAIATIAKNQKPNHLPSNTQFQTNQLEM
jgi:hypothetical protein